MPTEQKLGATDRQYKEPPEVVQAFGENGRNHLSKEFRAQFLLAILAGSFMTFGAVFSILLATGVEAKGLYYLLSGLGFTAAYVMVFLSGAVLFTEINILLPSYLFRKPSVYLMPIARFWLATYIGNIVGALFVAAVIQLSGSLTPEFYGDLQVYLSDKMKFKESGGIGWFQVVLSGILANWLIGMASFLTTAARDVTGKVVATALPVILFVAGNFQHSAANMGYFSMGVFAETEHAWYEYLLFNLIPASIGNLIGGALLVSLLFLFAYREELRDSDGIE